MNIKNISKVPLTIALPGGKKLRLGPGKVGQITAKAASNPAVTRMIDAGKIQLTKGGSKGARSGGSAGGVGASQRRGGGGAARQSGDR